MQFSYAIIFWLVILAAIFSLSNSFYYNDDNIIYYDITDGKLASNRLVTNIKKNNEDISIKQALDSAVLSRGQVIFQQCAICHSLKKGVPNRIGPNLFGIVGRKIASLDNFSYSKAMKDFASQHSSWDLDLLNQYLADPAKKIPGNRMAFFGLKKIKDRADLLLYLSQSTNI